MSALRIVITHTKTGARRTWEGGRLPITIGRSEWTTVRLDDGAVAKIHARIVERGGDLLLVDGGSGTGVWVRGRTERVRGEVSLRAVGLTFFIGPFRLDVERSAEPASPGGECKASSVTERDATPGVDPAAPDVAFALREIAPLEEAYRSAWTILFASIRDRADGLSDPRSRIALFEGLVDAYPLVAAQPSFQELVEGARAVLLPSSDPPRDLAPERTRANDGPEEG